MFQVKASHFRNNDSLKFGAFNLLLKPKTTNSDKSLF